MRVLLKGTPRGAPASTSSVDRNQQQDKNETEMKKRSSSASASASSKEAVSAAKLKKKMVTRSTSSTTHEEEEREDQSSKAQSSKDQSSRRSSARGGGGDGHEDKDKKKKARKKKERIPLIDRVPTAKEYDSDDSLERMIRQKSRYSRYMTEYDVNADNFADDDAAGDDGDGEDGEGTMDKYNAIARLWSNSTDSEPAQWRSWDNEEETPAPKKDNNKLLVAKDEDEISAMFHAKKPSSGKFMDELKKIVGDESKRRNTAASKNNDAAAINLNNTDLPLFSKVSKEVDIFKWEHIENTEGGQVETILDPLKASGLAANDGVDDNENEDEEDFARIIRPSSSDTSSLTDPIKREEMLIAARIRASANENENIKQPDVPRVLSLTKRRSASTDPAKPALPALTMFNSNDSTNEPRTGMSKGTLSTSTPPPTSEIQAKAASGEKRGDAQVAADELEKSGSLIEDTAAAKNTALENGDKIPKVDTLVTSSSSSSSKSSKTPSDKHNRQGRSASATDPKHGAKPTASGTVAAEVSDGAAPSRSFDATDETKKSSRQSFFSRVPLFRSFSGLRAGSRSKSQDNKSSTSKNRAGTPTPERVDSGTSGQGSDTGKDTTVQKPKSRRTIDKYTPTEEKKKTVPDKVPTPLGGGGGGGGVDENVVSTTGAKASCNDGEKVSSSDDNKKDTETTKNPADNDGEIKEPPPPCDNDNVASNDNPPGDSEQPSSQQNQDMNALPAATELDKQEPAWCDIGKRGLTPAERNLMYSKSLVNDSGSESTMDRVTGAKKANMVHKARKAKKAQMMELDEYSYAISVDEEPDVVQCLKFYYCGAVAHVFGVAIAATDCNNPKKQVKGTEVRTGLLSKIEEVDEVEAQRWRDDNTLSPKVEVILENHQEKPRPVDHVDIDLDKGRRQQFQRKKKTIKTEAQKEEKGEKKDEEEGSDDETADFEIERQISRVKEVTKMHFSLDEDSEENQRHEAMLRARQMADQPQPQRQEIPISSIRIPTKSIETDEEPDPVNPVVEETETEENDDHERIEHDESGLENDEMKKVHDDETMETGSSHESGGSGSKQPSDMPKKKKRLSRFLPRLRRKAKTYKKPCDTLTNLARN